MTSYKSTYLKFRDADDAPGNLAWAATMAKKALVFGSTKPDSFVEECALVENDERILCALLRIPRRYIDLENADFVSAERVRSIVRALVAAEVVEIQDKESGKPILPVEVNRIARKLSGDAPPKKSPGGLKARVYRPEVGLNKSSPVAKEAPKPVELTKTETKTEPKAAPVKKARLSADDMKFKKEIENQHRAIKEVDYYQFLGIGHSASNKEVHSAFVDRAKKWHPDRVSASAIGEDTSIVKAASELFQHLQKIERTLKDDAARADYDRRLGASIGNVEVRPAEAKVALQKAQVFERTHDLSKAKKHYEMAILFDPSLHQASVALAWLKFQDDKIELKERAKQARAILEPLADDKRFADAAYRLALIARTENKESEIRKRIEQALKCDPAHKEAAQEKRILDRRKANAKEASKSKSGGHKRLFGFGKK